MVKTNNLEISFLKHIVPFQTIGTPRLYIFLYIFGFEIKKMNVANLKHGPIGGRPSVFSSNKKILKHVPDSHFLVLSALFYVESGCDTYVTKAGRNLV